MRKTLRVLILFLLGGVAGLAQQHIDPSTQVTWPTGCTAGLVYSPFSNTCVSPSSTVGVNGVVVTASASAACGQFIRDDASGASTITLPASITTGCSVVVQRGVSAGAVTIDPNGNTYDGVTTQLPQGESVYVYTDGTGYHSSSPLLPGTHCTVTPGLTGNTLDCTGGTSPLTNKGDLYTFDTANARLGVGSDGQVLQADSTQAKGIKWATPTGGSSTLRWERQGIVIAPGPNDPSPQVQEVSAIWGTPEYPLYSSYSQVVKMSWTSGWIPTATGGQGVQICFGESIDGLKPPVPVGTCIANHSRSTLLKSGSNYLLYAKNESTGGYDIYSGTTLGGLTLAHSNVLACGSNGSEVAGSIGRSGIWATGGSGTNWNMLYSCSNGTSYAEWLATSTDSGVTWTKASTTAKLGTGGASSTPCTDISGAQVYVQSSTNLRAWAHCGPAGLVPTPYIYGFTSTDNGVTWSLDAAPSIQSQTTDEGVGLTSGQLGDDFPLDGGTLNKTIMYYSAYTDGCPNQVTCGAPSYVKAAVISSPLSTVATSTTSDGGNLLGAQNNQVNGTPVSLQGFRNLQGVNGANVFDAGNGVVQVSTGTLLSDSFARSSGALGANWAGSANVTIQAYGSVGDSAAGSTNDFAYYTGGGTLSADQCAYVTVSALPATGFWVSPTVRQTGAGDGYELLAAVASGNHVGMSIYKNVAGTLTLLGSTVNTNGKMAIGETYGLCVAGTTLTAYRNGTLTQTRTDSSIAGPGYPGVGFPSNTSGRISQWYAYAAPVGTGITALTGDATATGPGSAALTLATVNSNVGTCGDSSHVGQVTLDAKGRATACTAVAITAGGAASVPTCADTSGSGTAQVCSTSPTFTPVAGSAIVYTTTTANTGTGLTLNVNSLGAKSVAKWQTTTTLAANDIRANTQVLMIYDGTNWELSTIGTAPGGGGGTGAWTNITGSSQITATGCSQSASTGGYCSISGSSTTVVTFSAIPGTYTDLKILFWGQASAQASANTTVNSDTSAHYSSNSLYQTSTGNGTGSTAASTTNCPAAGLTTGIVSENVIEIPFYADTTFGHAIKVKSDEVGSISSLASNFNLTGMCGYNQTTAITSITFTLSTGNYVAGTKFMVLGLN